MQSLDQFAQAKLAALEARHLRRFPLTTDRSDAPWVTRQGRRLLSFSCNDYLGLSRHPDVIAAAVAAVERYGAGAGASRLVTGGHPLLAELEARLAALKGAEAAVVFGSGYLTNMGVVPALIGPRDLVLIDELAHACLWAGAQQTGGAVHRFRHNDLAHLDALLTAHRAQHPRAIILTDTVYSMDGDLAPLVEMGALAERHDAWLLSDDAHGIGVVGEGRGGAFAGGRAARVPLQMGTLSKAIGGYGGYLCASRAVVDLIKTRARPFIFSTGLPPASAAAAIAALDIIEADKALRDRPVMLARRFTQALGLPPAESAIVPVILGAETRALEASRRLEEQGYLVVAIRPPSVPQGASRLRVAFSAAHHEDEVDALAAAVRDIMAGPA